MTYSTHVAFELKRAKALVSKDRQQRWVTMDGAIHTDPQPFRDKISVYWMPLVGRKGTVGYTYSPRALAHSAIGAL